MSCEFDNGDIASALNTLGEQHYLYPENAQLHKFISEFFNDPIEDDIHGMNCTILLIARQMISVIIMNRRQGA